MQIVGSHLNLVDLQLKVCTLYRQKRYTEHHCVPSPGILSLRIRE
jgi:hypothetical protein